MNLLTRATSSRPSDPTDPADRTDATDLTDATDPADATEPARRPAAVLGLLAAAWAVAVGLAAVAVPCLLVWLAAPQVTASWADAVRVGIDAWLLAHGATVVLLRGEISLVPLGLTALPLLLCRSAGRRVARVLLRSGEHVAARTVVAAGTALAAGYAVLAAVVAIAVATPGAHPLEGQAALGGLVVAGLGAAAGLRPALGRRGWSPAVAVPARAALIALGSWVAASALLLAGALVLGWSRVAELAAALDAGVVGGAGLLAVQLALLPVAVVWAGAWWAGPGFAVGAGSAVTPAATGVGVVPALPLLGALPEPGSHPGWLSLAIAVPVLCGVPAGRRLGRRREAGPGALLRDTAVTAVLAAAAAAVLCGWASGAAGAGRMAELGPDPLWVGAAFGGEVLAGCVLGLLTVRARGGSGPDGTRRGDRPYWLPERVWAGLPAWSRRPLGVRRPS